MKSAYFIKSQDHNQLFIEGFGRGEVVLLLAGGPGFNANYIYPIAEKLSANYRAIILHQRGTTTSKVPKVDATSMGMEQYIADIEALRIQLNLKQINIVGHSWGGMLAMEYTAHHPEKVQKLILVGPGGPTPSFTTYVFDNIGMRLQKSDVEELATLSASNQPIFQANWAGYFFDRAMAMQSKSNIDWSLFYGQSAVDQFTIPAYFSTTAQRIAGLQHYKGIVHIIQGRQDPMGEATVFEIRDLLPQSKVHFIEKCGHFPWLEQEVPATEFFNHLEEALN